MATAIVAYVMLHAMQQAAAFDFTGQVEPLLPIARLGVITAPLIVALRALVVTSIAWLVAGALGHRLAFGTIAAGVLTWMPLLEIPALVDALAMLRYPGTPFADVHVALGLDALIHAEGPKLRVLAQTTNLALVAFTALLARHLAHRAVEGPKAAVPAALAAAITLVLMPLLRT